MRPLVSIILVNWNGKHHLHICLPSLFAQHYQPIEIIVVDNASTDESASYLRQTFPQVKLIINTENLGFADANNRGYLHATGEYILFLNNDTRVTADFLFKLVDAFKADKRIGGVQSKILQMDHPNRLDSVGAFLTYSGFLYHYGYDKKDGRNYSLPIELYTAKGACMMFRKDVLTKVLVDDELFDHQYFAYFEETDLCHRVWLAGYRIVFAPESIIYHRVGGTSKKIDGNIIQYHAFKNRINSYLKNLSLPYLIVILPLHLLLCELFAGVALIKSRRLSMFLTIQRAILWNGHVLANTLRKRRYIQQQLRCISDDRLFQNLHKHIRLTYYYHLFNGLSDYNERVIST